MGYFFCLKMVLIRNKKLPIQTGIERACLLGNPSLVMMTWTAPFGPYDQSKSLRINIIPATLNLAATCDPGHKGCLKPIEGTTETVFHTSLKAFSNCVSSSHVPFLVSSHSVCEISAGLSVDAQLCLWSTELWRDGTHRMVLARATGHQALPKLCSAVRIILAQHCGPPGHPESYSIPATTTEDVHVLFHS